LRRKLSPQWCELSPLWCDSTPLWFRVIPLWCELVLVEFAIIRSKGFKIAWRDVRRNLNAEEGSG
jgi:hypothetical protein